jgi:hypothetical protein
MLVELLDAADMFILAAAGGGREAWDNPVSRTIKVQTSSRLGMMVVVCPYRVLTTSLPA